MPDPLAMVPALSVLLLVVLILAGAVLIWGVIRARMWQRAYPWWDLKPKARLRYVLLHILYFFIMATIYTVASLFVMRLSVRQPNTFTAGSFVATWIGAVIIGGLLMVPPRAIAYAWHVVERRNRPQPIQPSATPKPLAPTPPLPGAPPTTGSASGSPQ